MRTTKEVLDDHLYLSKKGTIEEDLKRNYSEDIFLLTTHGTYKGHQGLKKLMKMLNEELPNASFEYKNVLIEREVGFLEWTGNSKKAEVKDGVDSYVVRDGRIVAQTIHYTVTPKSSPE